MANISAPYGFRHIGYLVGHPANFGNSRVNIAAADTLAVFQGDPILRKANGYVGKASVGSTQIHGVFLGCQYLSAVKGYTNYSNFFPANGDALADVAAWTISTPDATFQAQTGSSAGLATPATTAMIGLNVGFAYGVPNPRTGISAAYIDLSTVGTNPALPFKIVSLVTEPPATNGADPTTAFNDVVVTFNNADYRAGTTGI